MDKIRILIVDDHPVVRTGLRTLLSAQPDMEVVGEASAGGVAVERAIELVPDVVVMDITMEGMGAWKPPCSRPLRFEERSAGQRSVS